MNYFLPFWSSPDYRQTDRLQTTDNRQKVMHMSPLCKLHRWAQKRHFRWVHFNVKLHFLLLWHPPRLFKKALRLVGEPRNQFVSGPNANFFILSGTLSAHLRLKYTNPVRNGPSLYCFAEFLTGLELTII